ncbi:hypothetical protein [Isoptericola aurantiacus]|uniref:hypothetical protein n=1 Tax=Isoptericola aurantiacus TaxID=3377839 RepID=UPI00383BDF73
MSDSTYPCPRPTGCPRDGAHPSQANAVWWGCEPRPPRPFRSGDTVVRFGSEHVVDKAWWDVGQGWLACLDCAHGYHGAPAPAEQLTVRSAVPWTEPDLFEVCS